MRSGNPRESATLPLSLRRLANTRVTRAVFVAPRGRGVSGSPCGLGEVTESTRGCPVSTHPAAASVYCCSSPHSATTSARPGLAHSNKKTDGAEGSERAEVLFGGFGSNDTLRRVVTQEEEAAFRVGD